MFDAEDYEEESKAVPSAKYCRLKSGGIVFQLITSSALEFSPQKVVVLGILSRIFVTLLCF